MAQSNWAFFDVDKSTASIGGHHGIETLFGMPSVKVNHGIDQARALLQEITTREQAEKEHALFSRTSSETKIVFNDKGLEADVHGLVIDTLSLLFRQQKEMVVRERNDEMKSGALKALDKRAWGLIRDDVDAFMGYLSNCSFPVVVNCHAKSQENAIGKTVLKPEIQGSAQEAMLAYPDLIAYCVTGDDAPSGHDYGWFVGKDREHEDTKSRAHGLDPCIPQDFGILMNAFADMGQPNPFILILGKAGQGKTSALRTLNPNHEAISEHVGLTDFLDADEAESGGETDDNSAPTPSPESAGDDGEAAPEDSTEPPTADDMFG